MARATLPLFLGALWVLPFACNEDSECDGPFGLCVSPPADAGTGGGSQGGGTGGSTGGSAGQMGGMIGEAGNAGASSGMSGMGGLGGSESSGGTGGRGGTESAAGMGPGGIGGAGGEGCGDDEIACGAKCVKPLQDTKNCGECDMTCPLSYACRLGICMPSTCASTALFCENFEAGHATLFTAVSGTWMVTTASADGPSYEGNGDAALSIARGTQNLTDVVVSAGYRLLSGTGPSGGGLVARYRDESTYYGVIFAADGKARLVPDQPHQNCGEQDLSGFGLGDFSTFSLEVVDEPPNVHIRTRINSRILHDCVDLSMHIASGKVGFQVLGDAVVRFSHIDVNRP